jgi:hypothetical protein
LSELKRQRLWAGWRFRQNGNGAWQKPPVVAVDPKRLASSKKPEDWCDFDTALTSLGAGAIDGISLLLTEGGPVAGLDLDRCVDSATNAVKRWAQLFVRRAMAAKVYIELSPSGTGLRILGSTSADAGKVHRNELVSIKDEPARIEVYRNSVKPLSITGRQYGKGSTKLHSIDELVDWAVGFIDQHKSKAAKAGNGLDLDDVEQLVRDGAPEGADRSRELFRVIGHYVGIGKDADWIIEHLGQHPEGIGAKHIDRGDLAEEVTRCVGKFRAQAEAAAAPEVKRFECPS